MERRRRHRGGHSEVHPRVDPEIDKRLRTYSARVGVELSAVVNAALAQYLDRPSETALILRRLDRLSRQCESLREGIRALAALNASFAELVLRLVGLEEQAELAFGPPAPPPPGEPN